MPPLRGFEMLQRYFFVIIISALRAFDPSKISLIGNENLASEKKR